MADNISIIITMSAPTSTPGIGTTEATTEAVTLEFTKRTGNLSADELPVLISSI